MKLASKIITIVLVTALETKKYKIIDAAEIMIPDYGDLIRLYRDNDGVPILTLPGNTDCNELTTSGCCKQPLASDSADCPEECKTTADGVTVVIVDQDLCAIAELCATCTMETDFGRINVMRANPEVFESQLAEVRNNLQLSQCETTLDPAGRIVYYVGEVGYAVDSPLQNLAMYNQLITDGTLGGGGATPIPQGEDVLITAARSLGAAVDKSGGGVNIDMIMYVNRIMGLTESSTFLLNNKCIWYREEVMGAMKNVKECFLDYSRFSYSSNDSFNNLPRPAYIPDATSVGTFEYLTVYDSVPTFKIEQGSILNAVFGGEGYDGSNIAAFVKAADDTRKVILFMHDWPVPADYATNPTCEPRTPGYDAYIDTVQVPENIRFEATDREYSVSVGITIASGAEPKNCVLTVTGESLNAVGEVLTTYVDTFDSILLSPTRAMAQVAGFVNPVLTSARGVKTIRFAAAIKCELPDDDYEPGNDTFEASSNVIIGGGGGGGGGEGGGGGGGGGGKGGRNMNLRRL